MNTNPQKTNSMMICLPPTNTAHKNQCPASLNLPRRLDALSSSMRSLNAVTSVAIFASASSTLLRHFRLLRWSVSIPDMSSSNSSSPKGFGDTTPSSPVYGGAGMSSAWCTEPPDSGGDVAAVSEDWLDLIWSHTNSSSETSSRAFLRGIRENLIERKGRELTVSLTHIYASSKPKSALGRFSSENRKNGPQTSISVAMYLLFASVFGNPL